MRAFLLALVLAIGVAATAWAAIPDSSGAINGCYVKKGGKLRVLKAGKTCKKTERPLTWNQSGPIGPAGPKGPVGPKGPKGDLGSVYTTVGFDTLNAAGSETVGELDLPAGRYLVIATGGMSTMATDAGLVNCSLWSDDDDFFGSVSQTVPAGESTNLAGHVAIELSSAKSVRLECMDLADTDGVAATVVLSAIPAGSIVSQ